MACQMNSARGDDAALLAGMLDRLHPGDEGRGLAQRLLERFGTIGAVVRASPQDVGEVAGAGPATCGEIARIWLLVERPARADTAARPILDDPAAAAGYCRLLLAGERRERLHALLLDKSYRLCGQKLIQHGTIDHVTVYPREIAGAAIEAGAKAVVLVHNHPSGCATPSRGDIAMTAGLASALEPLGIEVADHIIVSGEAVFSFRLNGLPCRR